MKRALPYSRFPALAVAIAYLATSAAAGAQATPAPTTGTQTTGSEAGPEEAASRRSVTYFDLTGNLGYSSNPSLQSPSKSSAFGRLSLRGYHAWNSDRGSTWLAGYVENTTYVRGGYGSKQIFNLDAHADRAVSEKLRIYGDFIASGDIAGQLTNRFTIPGPVGTPPGSNPPPETIPDLNLTGRQYRVSGDVGAGITTSERSSVTISAGAQRGFFTGENSAADYTTYNANLGYSHQLSEPTSVGVTVGVQRQDLKGSDYANIVNTAVTISTLLGTNIDARGSVGVMAIYSHRFGESDHAYSPSFSASICKQGERSRLCASASRSVQTPLGIGLAQNPRSVAITTNFNLNYNRAIGRSGTIQASLTATHSSSVNVLLQDGKFQTTYVTGLLGYDRKVGNRLSAGLEGGARRLYQTGPDPQMDLNGSLYLRYRLGQLL